MKKKKKGYILIVDDIPVNLVLIEKLLEDLDANIIKANSGQEALDLIKKYDFALILLDVYMPQMDGFETSKRIRSSEETKHIPIIFITAKDSDEKHEFEGYVEQKNFATSLASWPYVLSLEADEALIEELKKSILKIKDNF